MKCDRAARIAHLENRLQQLEALRPVLDENVAQALREYAAAYQTPEALLALTNLRLAENQRAGLTTRLLITRRKLLALQKRGKE